jgi:hypothetical protein
MRNNKYIDLTALLDVMMIILFAVLMNIQTENIEIKQISQDNAKSIEILSIENHDLIKQNKALEKVLSEFNLSLAQFITMDNKNISLDNPEAFREEILKYNVVKSRFSFIDVHLKTNSNHLYINEQGTNIYIFYEQVSDPARRTSLKASIQEAIEAQLQLHNSNKPFYLLSLKEDGTVYRYAYTLVWEVIKDIESKYGPDRIFKLEVY